MIKFLILLMFLAGISFSAIDVFGIEIEMLKESDRIIDTRGWSELETDPLQEQLQIVIDQVNNKNQISVIILSTDENDISLPSQLKSKILNPRLVSVIFTNQFNCAERYEPKDDTCVHIAIERDGLGNNIDEIKKNTQEITDQILDQGILDFTPEFHSIRFSGIDEITSDNEKIEKSIATATYTLKKYSTEKLLNAFSHRLISTEIMNGGGFFSIAEELSINNFAEFTLTYVPKEQETLRILNINLICSNILVEYTYCLTEDIDKQIKNGQISPLDFIQLENLNRSEKFLDGFLPLSSIVQVVILSDQDFEVKSVNSNIIKKLRGLGDIQDNGWFFESDSGQVIDGRYLFGLESSISKNDLIFSIGPNTGDDIKINEGGGGCLIATAAFDSELSPQVQFLREIRDNTVLQTTSGSTFMMGFNQLYYSFSPTIADYARESPIFKESVKLTLTPLLASLTLLQYTDIDSEFEMLGYGIGVILLNIVMYFVIPAALIMKIKKRI